MIKQLRCVWDRTGSPTFGGKTVHIHNLYKVFLYFITLLNTEMLPFYQIFFLKIALKLMKFCNPVARPMCLECLIS